VSAGAIAARRSDVTWSSTVRVRSLWRESSGELVQESSVAKLQVGELHTLLESSVCRFTVSPPNIFICRESTQLRTLSFYILVGFQ
jgi:hypothetical protein